MTGKRLLGCDRHLAAMRGRIDRITWRPCRGDNSDELPDPGELQKIVQAAARDSMRMLINLAVTARDERVRADCTKGVLARAGHLRQMARYFRLDAVLEMISNLAKMSVDAKDEPARALCVSALLDRIGIGPSEFDKTLDQIAAYRAAQQIKADPPG